ncbi:sensor histidine kinase [Nonomuraea gerenzanensis]|uniref:histidine kinase n=1 Tax=Nonomuraea gerenzanensis TaxID=93944 RepID=A0A1M4E2V2_9ACTN|nr:HAMP domain-containing sensor histidine kinase [Nonomuraea gerenzanensis]UBU15394.1 HAMP domain-containing histidine kinase [Nonomuraea gerenzanensis]SBO93147.1 sensor histidine kinase [Nonomuraea gerenzanensis]
MRAWSLRARLVMAVLGLAALGLVLSNVIGIALLRDHLMDRVDGQLQQLTRVSSVKAIQSLTQLPTGWNEVLRKRLAALPAVMIFGPDGTLRSSGSADSGPRPVVGDIEVDVNRTVPGTTGPSWRVRAVRMPDGGTMVFAQSLAELEQTQTAAAAIAVAVSLSVLLLLGLAASTVVRLGLRPLTRMESTAGHIARGDFARRVHAEDPHTEPGRLAIAMNVMLDRLQSEIAARTDSEARMRRFLADASHELRTPLTSVRGFAELHRRGGGDADEAMRRIEDEAARMGVLVNDLLTLAQLDEERPLDRRPVDLLEVAADTIRDARVRVPDRQVRLAGLDGRLTPVSVVGDEARLRQVAANLVGNALCHTPPEASITVKVGSAGRQGVLEISDTGPGIPAEHVPHLFDRLYRVGPGRSRADGGAGLGLAIVAAIVRAHGGRVELDTAPGEGTTFRVLLPGSEVTPSPL